MGSGTSGGSCKKKSSQLNCLGGTLDGSDKVTEHEFNNFIANLSKQKGIEGPPLDSKDCPANEKFPEEEGGDTPRHQNNRKSFAPDESDKNHSILPHNMPLQQGLLDESNHQRKSSYISEYQTVNSTNATNSNNRRQSEQTVDYTIDTWSKTEDQEVGTTLSTSRRQSSFLFDLEGTSTTTGMISDSILEEGTTSYVAADYKEGGEGETSSEFDYHHHTTASGENRGHQHNKGGDKSTNATTTNKQHHYHPQTTRRATPSHRQFQSLRSSLRRSSIDENDKSSTPKPDSISWASLIYMESERSTTKKTKRTDKKSPSTTRSPSSSRRNMMSKNKYGESSCSSLELSHATPDSSKVSSMKSIRTRNSLGSNKSKKSNVSWKDESTMTTTFYTKDEAHIASQALERFERGVYYASKKMYTAARERFLMALRYRVKYYGEPNHVQCAAVHEMLGCVHYCLSREVMMAVVGGSTDEEDVDDEFDIYLPKLDNGRTDSSSSNDDWRENSMMMLSGWDMTVENEDKEVKRKKGRLYLEKAAMHFRTVLDMLKVMANDTGTNPKETPSSVSLGTSGYVGDIQWFELAKTYEGLDDGHDNASEDALKEIVSRVRSRLDLFPATMTTGNSYASTFLNT